MLPTKTVLSLVRHGQASAMSSDYDQLSPLGVEQSRLVGAHLASWCSDRWAAEPPVLVIGPRRRHRQTFDAMAEGARARGLALGEPAVLDELDEHHGLQLLTRVRETLPARTDALGEAARLVAVEGDARAFVRLIREALIVFSRGELSHPDVEPWADFRARTDRALASLGARGGHVVAVTSGGAIGAMTSRALGLGDDGALELMWSIANASITDIAYGKHGRSLRSFNLTAHLESEQRLTFV